MELEGSKLPRNWSGAKRPELRGGVGAERQAWLEARVLAQALAQDRLGHPPESARTARPTAKTPVKSPSPPPPGQADEMVGHMETPIEEDSAEYGRAGKGKGGEEERRNSIKNRGISRLARGIALWPIHGPGRKRALEIRARSLFERVAQECASPKSIVSPINLQKRIFARFSSPSHARLSGHGIFRARGRQPLARPYSGL